MLHELSFSADAGVLGLLGVNGAGKSTLLESLAGLLPPRSGHVLVDGVDVYGAGRRSRAVGAVALVPQHLGFPGRFTVTEYLQHMAWMRAVPKVSRAAAVDAALDAVDLTAHARQAMGRLSGGTMRRAAIAQALLADPAVLLLDESTTGLDPVQRAEVRGLLEGLAQTRLVVLASHIVEDIEQVASRVVVVHDGRIVFDGTSAEIASLGPAAAPPGVEGGFLALVGGLGS